MEEFDESYDSEPVDSSDYSSDTSSEMEGLEDYIGNSSSDSYEEDVSKYACGEQDEYATGNAVESTDAELKPDDDYVEDKDVESELSPAELREQADQEAADAQQEAEKWADENNMDTWSDGTPRQNYEETDDGEKDSSDIDSSDDTTDSGDVPLTSSSDGDFEPSSDRDSGDELNENMEEEKAYLNIEYGYDGLDPNAAYSDSHFPETDVRHGDEQSEMAEMAKLQNERNLNEFNRLQEEQTGDEVEQSSQDTLIEERNKSEEEVSQETNEDKSGNPRIEELRQRIEERNRPEESTIGNAVSSHQNTFHHRGGYER